MRLHENIDFTTLTWVKPELDETLKQARHALQSFVEDGEDAGQLHACGTLLHQVQGTLRMVELYGAAMVAEEMEQLARALIEAKVQDRDNAYAVLMQGIVQLPDYLERLQSGHRDIPIVLLPLLNQLRESRGEKGLSESVLFSPDLARSLPHSARGPEAPLAQPELRRRAEMLHSLFQSALLRWLKDDNSPSTLRDLTDVCEQLVPITSAEAARRLFWVAAGTLDALGKNAFPISKALKQALAKVEREIKRLADGGDAAFRSDPPIELTKQLLYFVAHEGSDAGRVGEIREIFGLTGGQPSEAELAHARGSLSGHNRALLETVAFAIKEDLLRVKDALDIHLRTPGASPATLGVQVEALDRVADTLGMLGLGVPRRVVQDQRNAIHGVVSGERRDDEATLLDIAGALLYVEAALDDQVDRLGQDQASQDEASQEEAAALPSNESRKLLEVLAKEAISNFAQARQCFVAFVETHWDHAQLSDVPRLLEEVSGALRILDIPLPAEYLTAIRRFTENELLRRRRVPNGQQMDRLADALASLEYFLEALRDRRPNRSQILDLAKQSLESLGYWPLPTEDLPVAPLAAVASKLTAAPRVSEPEFAIPANIPDISMANLATEPVVVAEASIDPPMAAEIAVPFVSEAPEAAELHVPEALAELPPIAETAAAQSVAGKPRIPGFDGVHNDEIDDEIREVFLEEFEEEIANLDHLLPPWRAQPGNAELLRPIRRVFHTLKGSGRLVGAKTLGEFSWKVENLLNRVLDGSRPASPAVVLLIEHAFNELPLLRAALQGESVYADLEGIQSAAERLAAGEEFQYRPAALPADIPDEVAVETQSEAVEIPEVVEAAPQPEPEPFQSEEEETDGEMFAIDPVLFEILKPEVEGHLETVDAWLAACARAPQPVSDPLLRAIHTMNGAFAMTDVAVITEVTAPLEGFIKRSLAHQSIPAAEGVAAVADAAQAIRRTISALERPRPELPNFDRLAAHVRALRDALPDTVSPAGGLAHYEAEVTSVMPQAVMLETPDVSHIPEFDRAPVEEITHVRHVAEPALDGLAQDADPASGQSVADESAALEAEASEVAAGKLTSGEPAPIEFAATELSIDDLAGFEAAIDAPLAQAEPEAFAPAAAEEAELALVDQDSALLSPELAESEPEESEPEENESFAHIESVSGEVDALQAQEAEPAIAGNEPPVVAETVAEAVVEPAPALAALDADAALAAMIAAYAAQDVTEAVSPASSLQAAIAEPSLADEAAAQEAEVEPEAVQFETPVASESVAETSAHEDAIAGDFVLEDPALEEAVLEETALDDSLPEDTLPEMAAPEEQVLAEPEFIEPELAGSEPEAWMPEASEREDSLAESAVAAEEVDAPVLESADELLPELEAAGLDGQATADIQAPAAEVSEETYYGLSLEELEAMTAPDPVVSGVPAAPEVESEPEALLESLAESDPASAGADAQLNEFPAAEDFESEPTEEVAVSADMPAFEDVPAVAETQAAPIDEEQDASAESEIEELELAASEDEAAAPDESGIGTIIEAEAEEPLPDDAVEIEAEYSQAIEAGDESDSEAVAAPVSEATLDSDSESIDELVHAIRPTVPLAADPDDPDADLDTSDLDSDLLDIFLEESSDILDHSDGLLARLRDHSDDRELIVGLQRDLHTLKGGARMSGIYAVGDLGHAMESLLEAVAEGRQRLSDTGVIVLERGFDRLQGMVTRIGQRKAIALPAGLIAQVEALSKGQSLDELAAGKAEPDHVSAPVAAPAVAPIPLKPLSAPIDVLGEDDEPAGTRAPQEQVRIRADLLDRLVNYAGEVAIYRARLEQQLGAFRSNLGELNQTTTRLREQLRRLEIETEAQIIARYQREGETANETFDPLELDRFTNQQQLSRALSESANDLVNLQGILDELTRQYETLLLQQSRVSSDLQEGLMRTRMVPFDALVPRLRRVLRQAASDTGKQVQLKVDGASGEMDRNVLERMTAPLEHMLRNAMAHGLELPQERRKAKKAEEGTVRIAVQREGSEVVLRISDDGRGLNKDAIRRKAIERELIAADAELSDQALYALILEPGFSTAETVSRLAGRGVGMDVVYSEIRQLGGSLTIHSTEGKGSEFVIRLPFTLAVTQAVFVAIGDTSFAVPIASVQGVGRISRSELEKQLASEHPVFNYAGEDYAIHDLGHLIGHSPAKAQDSLQMPLLLARSGDLRAAISIDQVLGSREIVVKPVGPQVNSVPGIFGATIMGDGRVVVILDVAPLVRRHRALVRETAPAAAAPAAVAHRVPVVMVVDDSITMRKVTGRVLERNNMEVLTAKDGVDAIEKMAERVPDLVLLDIEMPRMDGYEVAQNMRSDPHLKDVPIIMITSRTGDKHRQRAMDIGVNRYLGKPYQEFELMRNVFEMLGMEPVNG